MGTEQRLKRKQGNRVPDELLAFRDQYVTAAGAPDGVSVEHEIDDRKNDHVWIGIRAGDFGRVEIALSTMSRQSAAAGLDPRVRVGISTSAWSQLPQAGIRRAPGLNYAQIEANQAIEYAPFERPALEQLLVSKARRAILVEAWGEFYVRAHIGVHQVHSRRASSAVSRDLIGQDGAVRFYFESPNESEMLFFKFAGQP